MPKLSVAYWLMIIALASSVLAQSAAEVRSIHYLFEQDQHDEVINFDSLTPTQRKNSMSGIQFENGS